MQRQIVKPVIIAARQASSQVPVKFVGQTPSSFVHDGWAGAFEYRSMQRQIVKPVIIAARQASSQVPVKFVGQTPSSFVHDGWAGARLPFNVRNRWLFFTKATLFLATGIWAPFLVVEYQLRKANQ
uniref:Cytochrome c oxidase polypeptide VIIc n=1 Tax=Ascaris lumbricoides TaxID=6252 RepID=A0A0M3I0F0_ASCLU